MITKAEVRGILYQVIPLGMISEKVIGLITDYFVHIGYKYFQVEAFFKALFLNTDEDYNKDYFEEGTYTEDGWEYDIPISKTRRYWNDWIRSFIYKMKEELWNDECLYEQCHIDKLAQKGEHEVWFKLAEKLNKHPHRIKEYRDEYGFTPAKAEIRKRISRARAEKLGLLK